ncbi:hypothetical protein CEXT_412411 [Caerostris extrusa]|uniref:Uncharacterized protein n=1 Tax=Caerostris extrusa TaxID=172846 RepID=A0AAV4TM78_CAEEX|nr:hypothetical protein CEXT_412411 [Caerostris extrusa]
MLLMFESTPDKSTPRCGFLKSPATPCVRLWGHRLLKTLQDFWKHAERAIDKVGTSICNVPDRKSILLTFESTPDISTPRCGFEKSRHPRVRLWRHRLLKTARLLEAC